MLTRVVKLTFQLDHIDTFKAIFEDHRKHINNFNGCIELNAYQDKKNSGVFFTISKWEDELALDNYRFSDFFKSLWSKVKPLFAAKAEAHSLTLL